MWGDRDSEVTVLDRADCLALLSRVSVGRIGASIEALPVILPVHFALFEESVLFRTIPGTRLDAASIGAVIAFQADAYEPREGSGWSVLLQGIPTPVDTGPGDVMARSVPITPWVHGPRDQRLVRLEATTISGRRFRIAGEGPAAEFPDPLSL